MSDLPPSDYNYQPSVTEKAVSEVKKRGPFILARIIQYILYGLFQTIQFIKQVIVDAFTR